MEGMLARAPRPEVTDPLSTPDPRWGLVKRAVASRHFAKSPLLSKFLLYVCDRALKGREEEISEHQIGVEVFGRPEDYDPGEDNIVRNYARQLRKRLSEYFADEGLQEPFRLEIPRGGYVPSFYPRGGFPTTYPRGGFPTTPPPAPDMPMGERPLDEAREPAVREPYAPASREAPRLPSWLRFVLLGVYSAALIGAGIYLAAHLPGSAIPQGASHQLWKELFSADSDTFVVPADAGFGILQNLGQKRLSLADYANGAYSTMPLPAMDPHNANDLRTQRYTSVVDLEIATALSHRPEVVAKRFILRFARDLRMDDLKQGSAILIGSAYSNPWAEVFQHSLNFRFDYKPEQHNSWIINQAPRPGEGTSYENNWDGPSHQTFAVVAFVPNLNGSGHVLLIQGLDMAATQAAAEFVCRDADMAPILQKATRPNGSLGPFEVLLQTTSIGANAPSARVVASRFPA